MNEDDVLPLFHPRDEATTAAADSSLDAALTAPDVQNVVFYVLFNSHISKAGVKRMRNDVLHDVDMPTSAIIAHPLDCKSVALHDVVLEDQLAPPIVQTRTSDLLADEMTSVLCLAPPPNKDHCSNGPILIYDTHIGTSMRSFIDEGPRPHAPPYSRTGAQICIEGQRRCARYLQHKK